MRDSHQGITSGIHSCNGRSPKGVRDDSSHSIHLAAEFFAKRRSLKQLGGDNASLTRAGCMGGKHDPLQHALLSNESRDPVFNDLDLFLPEHFFLLCCEESMTVRTDQQVPAPIPDEFRHMEGALPFFCNHNQGLFLEFPTIAVGTAKQTFPVIVVNAIYPRKCLFQTCGEDDGSGLHNLAVVRNKLKPALMLTHITDPHMPDCNGRILADFLMRNASELAWFHAIACQKSMRLLRHSISRPVIIKHQNGSPGSPQDKRRI